MRIDLPREKDLWIGSLARKAHVHMPAGIPGYFRGSITSFRGTPLNHEKHSLIRE
jgi:hypothetical protein